MRRRLRGAPLRILWRGRDAGGGAGEALLSGVPDPAEAPTVGAQRRRVPASCQHPKCTGPRTVRASGCVSAARRRFRNLRQPFGFVCVFKGRRDAAPAGMGRLTPVLSEGHSGMSRQGRGRPVSPAVALNRATTPGDGAHSPGVASPGSVSPPGVLPRAIQFGGGASSNACTHWPCVTRGCGHGRRAARGARWRGRRPCVRGDCRPVRDRSAEFLRAHAGKS